MHLRHLLQRLSWCPVLRAAGQAQNQVTIRPAGRRFLSAPLPIPRYAKEHWQYAWLADVAYDSSRVVAGTTRVQPQFGWTRWEDFPNADLHARIDRSHLRVEVWERRDPHVVAVAFGGTVFNNRMDWRSNLRWFIFGRSGDEYSTLVQTLAPAFIEEYKRRAAASGSLLSASTNLVSTGHSLGGGLAQQFAYCLPADASVPRVRRAYVFDPSPVTGYFSVDRSVRDINTRSLHIERIYERGEILAVIRSVTSVFFKPSARSPAIEGFRYSLFYSCNPIAGHSMKQMAGKLAAAAGQDTTQNAITLADNLYVGPAPPG